MTLSEHFRLYSQDGYVHLCTADLQRVSQDVVQDVKEIIKQGNGEQQLSFSQFCRYMDEVQVPLTSHTMLFPSCKVMMHVYLKVTQCYF